LAREINEQWLRSKGDYDADELPRWSFTKQTGLVEALQGAFPEWHADGNDGTENPLRLILPGYETLWRVVLRCFVELTSRSPADAADWCTCLQAFLDSPTSN